MQQLINLYNKYTKKIIGIMSGTSLDGIDICLIEVQGNSFNTKIKLLAYEEFPFPDGYKDFTLKNSLAGGGTVDDICKLNFVIARIYAEKINEFLTKYKFDKNEIDLIGTHGQTIHHLPGKGSLFGFSTASTLQIGDPSVLAKLTGITTVGDFRNADIALGGQGAPLVPYFDFIMFSHPQKNIALLNIGGISNITVLPSGQDPNKVIAFDTGPGNMLIDYISKIYFNVPFDKNAEFAKLGTLNEELFNKLLELDTYINQSPPKSTGRELYNENFINQVLQNIKLDPKDILHTFTYYTAFTIYHNYQKFIKDNVKLDELYLSGGGANNPLIIEYLKKLFTNSIYIGNTNELGINYNAKEAICFAILANETISGNANNLPSVTGASRQTILGKICLP